MCFINLRNKYSNQYNFTDRKKWTGISKNDPKLKKNNNVALYIHIAIDTRFKALDKLRLIYTGVKLN